MRTPTLEDSGSGTEGLEWNHLYAMVIAKPFHSFQFALATIPTKDHRSESYDHHIGF
jgi:hypothetical protein